MFRKIIAGSGRRCPDIRHSRIAPAASTTPGNPTLTGTNAAKCAKLPALQAKVQAFESKVDARLAKAEAREADLKAAGKTQQADKLATRITPACRTGRARSTLASPRPRQSAAPAPADRSPRGLSRAATGRAGARRWPFTTRSFTALLTGS